jgi:hypothetical protein
LCMNSASYYLEKKAGSNVPQRKVSKPKNELPASEDQKQVSTS